MFERRNRLIQGRLERQDSPGMDSPGMNCIASVRGEPGQGSVRVVAGIERGAGSDNYRQQLPWGEPQKDSNRRVGHAECHSKPAGCLQNMAVSAAMCRKFRHRADRIRRAKSRIDSRLAQLPVPGDRSKLSPTSRRKTGTASSKDLNRAYSQGMGIKLMQYFAECSPMCSEL